MCKEICCGGGSNTRGQERRKCFPQQVSVLLYDLYVYFLITLDILKVNSETSVSLEFQKWIWCVCWKMVNLRGEGSTLHILV